MLRSKRHIGVLRWQYVFILFMCPVFLIKFADFLIELDCCWTNMIAAIIFTAMLFSAKYIIGFLQRLHYYLDGFSPLPSAAESNQLGALEFLLEINLYNHYDMTRAFSAAAEKGQLEMVELLLNKGDWGSNWQSYGSFFHNDIKSALNKAAKNGHLEIVELLLDTTNLCRGEYYESLSMAAKNGHLEIVELLLKKNGWFDVCVCYNLTYGQLKVIKWLIESGADNTGVVEL